MHPFELLFGPLGPALQYIFAIGYIPNQDDFLELTEEQYVAYIKQCGETNERIFMFLPQNPNLLGDDYNEVSCLRESELQAFKDAADLILLYCRKEDKVFNTTEEKLRFMASRLPTVFTEGTAYEKYHHLSVDCSNLNAVNDKA